jgi:hypothetical protein
MLRATASRVGGNGRDHALTALLILEMLMLFVGAPLAAMGIRLPLDLGVLVVAPLILTIVMISPSPGARVLALAAALLGVTGVAFRIRHPSLASVWLGHAATITAVVALSLVIGKAVFAPGRVTHHRIEGAVILYLNIAVLFTAIFRLISELDPGAFADFAGQQQEAAALSGMLYFSFTTLTATGFGEILPISPLARSMANLESVMGQLYLAILLARLVALQVEVRR